ncbi:MAG: transketolase [Verrucomicrobiota bacterium]
MTQQPPSFATEPIEKLVTDTIKTLTVDAVEKANSGHPGLPMGCADFAFVLWTKFLRFNPKNPHWAGRDRFVLSAGHGSMLIYSLLHLTGFEQMTLDQLKQFRQWGSITPGHPESHETDGVEVTTGPLGQGTANSVGLAMAQKFYGATFNTDEHPVCDGRTFAIVSDGDLQEGVSHEGAALAGHLGLDNLIWFYDDNHVTIEGMTSLSYSDDVPSRFRGYHWHVIEIDGNNQEECESALTEAIDVKGKPVIIVAKTIIGKGSPGRQGTPKAHSDAFGAEEVKATKENLGWPVDAEFLVPDRVKEFFAGLQPKWQGMEDEWNERFQAWAAANPEKKKLWDQFENGVAADELEEFLPVFEADEKGLATRASGGKVLEAIFEHVPNFIGGSADLAPSTKTWIKPYGSYQKEGVAEGYAGRNLHFGIREHGMGAIVNGFAYHGGLIPFGSTFFVFLDYMRPPVRLAAISKLQSIFVFTHDSIFVGEDGPTHEPVEHHATLRCVPNLDHFRPGDANEVSYAYLAALGNTDKPTVLALTRQNVPTLPRGEGACAPASGTLQGGYVLWESEPGEVPDIILIGSGSELHLAYEAGQQLATAGGIKVRVVSLPCWSRFDHQSAEYRESVLPKAVTKRLAVEAGSDLGWDRYLGPEGQFVGVVDKYGASAPAKTIAEKYGLTTAHVLEVAKGMV